MPYISLGLQNKLQRRGKIFLCSVIIQSRVYTTGGRTSGTNLDGLPEEAKKKFSRSLAAKGGADELRRENKS